jgi:hypothetical protein
MKFRTMWLAVAGVVGSVAVAHAQPAPEEPPAPPPPAEPPAAPAPEPAAPVPPAPPPPAAAAPEAPPPGIPEPTPAPPPPPVLTWGNAPQADKTIPVGAPKPPSKFAQMIAGSKFTWNHSATTKLLGVGSDYIGLEDQVYSWDFVLDPRFVFYDKGNDQVYAFAQLDWYVELTNSDTTTTQRELQFKDLQLGVGYNRKLWTSKDGEYATVLNPTFRFLLPTSSASRNEGKYLTTSLGAKVNQTVKILGQKSDWFPNTLLSVGLSWGHLFAESYNPVNADLARPRQTATGSSFLSDQLSMSSFNQDQVKLSFVASVPIWKDLSFSNSWAVVIPVKHQFSTRCVQIANDRACPPPDSQATTGVPVTTFDISLAYELFGVGSVDIGYQNEAPQLGEDGQRRDMFYSPNALFYMDFVAYIDGIYEKSREALEKRNKKTAKELTRGIDY